MKTQLLKSAIVLFLIPALTFAHKGWKGKYTKEKKINKEYTVNADALLKIKNSYGNLYVTSWNENKVVIEVHIKTNGNNEEKVQKKLDEIDVLFEASQAEVSARTVFEKNKWGWNRGKNNVSMQINYTVKVPVTNRVSLNNDYGSINLDKIEGKAIINCDYGRLDIGELLGDDNYLSFDYTSKSNIGYMKNGKINADYSGFTLEKTGNLLLNADYTNASIGSMKNLQYSCDYGSLTVEESGSIQGNGDYVSTRFGTVHGDIDISSDYGSIKIARLASDAGDVRINSGYTGVKIGYDEGYSFNFTVRLDYASLKGEGLEYTTKEVRSNEKKYEGYHGNKNSGNTVYIDSEYGGVTLYKN